MNPLVKIYCLFIVLCLIPLFSWCDCRPKDIYSIKIEQTERNRFEVEVEINLSSSTIHNDTICFDFGGIVPTYSIEQLNVESGKTIPYTFDQSLRKFHICSKEISNNLLMLKYAFNSVWGISKDSASTLLENKVEYFIPNISNSDTIMLSGTIKPLDKFYVLSSLPLKNNQIEKKFTTIKNASFLFMENKRYKHTTHFSNNSKINIFTTDSSFSNNEHIRLASKVINCLNYFSLNISPYRYNDLNIVEMEWNGSTYFGGLCIVDKKQFKSYTLFHEIVHEWINGIIPIIESSKGEFLIGESINEYLMLQFLKQQEGDSLYVSTISRYKNMYENYLTKNIDLSIMSITKYTSSTHFLIIYKQVFLLDELAKTLGYEELNSSLYCFLKSRINKPTASEELLDYLQEKYGKIIIEYRRKI